MFISYFSDTYRKEHYALVTTSGSCVKGRCFTVKRRLLPCDFADVCKHASATCDSGDEERVSSRAPNQRPGECRGRGHRVALWKIVRGYTVITCTPRLITATMGPEREPGVLTIHRGPCPTGNRGTGGPRTWDKYVSYLCYCGTGGK